MRLGRGDSRDGLHEHHDGHGRAGQRPADAHAYRTGTSAWKIPTPRDGGTYAAHHYELDVSDDYEVVAAATNVEGTGLTYSYELLATVDDGTRWYLQAGGAIDLTVSTPGPSTPSDDGLCTFTNEPQIYSGGITVSGEMAQPGEVSFGTFCEEPLGTTTGSWSYAIATPPGTGDLIATNGARFSIMRSLDFQQSATVPTIDLTSGGEPFASQSVTVVNTGVYPNDEGPIGSELQLFTSHGGAILTTEQDEVASTSHVVPLVPSSTLVTGDRELLTVSVQDTSNATRSGWTYAPTATSTFLLLDEPTAAGAVRNGVATVTWSGELDPRVQFVNINSTYNVSTPTFSYFSQGVTATPHWLAAHSATSLGFDTSVPGYDPSWDIEGGPTTGTSFSVSAIGPQDGGYSTTRTLPLQ
jgi:hypothetical protein